MTLRYALIIGNNQGVDVDGSNPFFPLQHAEREAKLLKETLVEYSNFDALPRRTRLMLGASKAEVQQALSELARQKKQDEKTFGQIDSMFLFFFTGHGLEGRLLLSDGVLKAHEIGALFTEFDADFSVGVFDACFAGSLDTAALASKGIRSAPGLNLFRELPEEVLSAEGRIWYVSSSRQQESYEDKQLGGVFTHFFIEGIQQATPEGPGITLDSIWRYAQSRTVEYTALRKRIQVPEQFINQFRSSTPVYFSFPTRRTATLVLSDALEGRFALTYANGSLTEIFEKKRGEKQTLAVYPGRARVLLIDRHRTVTTQTVTLKPKTSLLLSTLQEIPPSASVGEHAERLFEKGVAGRDDVVAVHIKPGVSVLGGVGYGFEWTDNMILGARHGFRVPLRIDVEHFILRLNFQYGFDKRSMPTWAYTINELGGGVAIGYGLDLGRVRMGATAALQLMYINQRYRNGEKRYGYRHRPALKINLLFPRTGRFQGEAFVDAGPLYAPGIGASSGSYWRFSATVGMAFYFRLY